MCVSACRAAREVSPPLPFPKQGSACVVSIPYSHTWLPPCLFLITCFWTHPTCSIPFCLFTAIWSELAAAGISTGETGGSFLPLTPTGLTEALQQQSPREPLAGSREGRLGSRDTAGQSHGSCPRAVLRLRSFGNWQPGGWRGLHPGVPPTQTISHGLQAVIKGTRGSLTLPSHTTWHSESLGVLT